MELVFIQGIMTRYYPTNTKRNQATKDLYHSVLQHITVFHDCKCSDAVQFKCHYYVLRKLKITKLWSSNLRDYIIIVRDEIELVY